MKLRTLVYLISGLMLATALHSCTNAKAGQMRQNVEAWISDILTPSNTTLEKAETGYELKSSLKNKPNNLVILWEMGENLVLIDSTRTDAAGNFKFKGNIKEPVFCMLQWGENSNIYLYIDNKTNATLEINPDDPANYSIQGKGIEGTMELKDLISLNNSFNIQFGNIENQINKLGNTPEAYGQVVALQTQFRTLIKKRNDDIEAFALSKKKSFLPYFIVKFKVLEAPSFKLLDHAVKQCRAINPTSKYTVEMEARFKAESMFAIGAVAPDFKLPQVNGDTLSLSSLRGKVVLIDFWASWCGPCRRENPYNTQMYKRFKDKGFEILGVSLDDNAGRWKGAIAADSLVWKHVSELRGWDGKINRMYQISSIPSTVLLDKQGRIIAKGLRGEELNAKLTEIFGNAE